MNAKKTVKCIASMLVALALAQPLPTLAEEQTITFPYEGYAITQTNLYATPNGSGKELAGIPADTDLTVLDSQNVKGKEWLHVTLELNGQYIEGYILGANAQEHVKMTVYDNVYSVEELSLAEWDPSQILGTTSQALPDFGEATAIYERLGIYSGEYENHMREGQGVFVWENGDVYIGEWDDDFISGIGSYYFADGIVASGTFSKSQFVDGTITIPQLNNGSLTAEVSKGKVTNHKKLTWPDGTIIEGVIPNGQRTFTGDVYIMYFNGDTYLGALKDGKKSGTGTYTWTDESHYVGTWADDKMQGSGTYYYTKNEKSNYLKGNFIANKLEGEATYIAPNGIKYVTKWKNNKCTNVTYKK